MTALERAELIVKSLLHGCVIHESHAANIRDMIHAACIEHSNAELERRRVAEALLRKAVDHLEALAMRKEYERTLKALEGGDA